MGVAMAEDFQLRHVATVAMIIAGIVLFLGFLGLFVNLM
jgi:hypothetical protein